jgi:hypothetical protein
MRKLCLSVIAAGALVGSAPGASAFEAMLGGNFALHDHPRSHHHIMILGAGGIVNIDHCDHGWCAVTHGPHTGYIYLTHVLDGRVYGPRDGSYGYRDGGPAELFTAPANAAGEAFDAGVSILHRPAFDGPPT